MVVERPDVLLVGEQTAHVARLAAGLIERGLLVACLNGPRLQQQLRSEYHRDITNHSVPVLQLRGRYRVPWVQHVERWAERVQLGQLLSAVQPRVVHINSIAAEHTVWAELGPACPPVVATVWGTDVHTFALHGTARQRRDISTLLRHARIITADAPYMLELVQDIIGPRPPDTQRLALFGIDVEPFAVQDRASQLRWSLRLDLEPGAPVVLAPRRINPRYAPQRVLEAFARSALAARGHLVFKLFGDNPGEEPRQQQALETRAAELGVQERLRFAHACPYAELPGLYQLADVGCFLLDRDGTPSTAMELWAAGVPMICADIPHYRDILVHGRNALLVAPQSTSDATEALNAVLADRPQYAAMVRRGQAWVRTHASSEAMLDAMLDAYAAAAATDPFDTRAGSRATAVRGAAEIRN